MNVEVLDVISGTSCFLGGVGVVRVGDEVCRAVDMAVFVACGGVRDVAPMLCCCVEAAVWWVKLTVWRLFWGKV